MCDNSKYVAAFFILLHLFRTPSKHAIRGLLQADYHNLQSHAKPMSMRKMNTTE